MTEKFQVERDGPTARLVLTNPDKHNAFDDALIHGLTDAFQAIGADPSIRVMVLQAQGRSFSAGADLSWMRSTASYSDQENVRDAKGLAVMLATLNAVPKPTVALVQGAAIGGGVGLVSCCDIAIASETAVFALSEVRLGLTPATIAPFVVAAIGARQARRYFQTAERFGADRALHLGLVHEVVDPERLADRAADLVADLLKGAPGAQTDAKTLIATVTGQPPDQVADYTARQIASRRASEEGKAGIAAFFDRRPAPWVSGGEGAA